MSEQKEMNAKEAHQKHLEDMPWPPLMKLEEGEEFALDELDVNWMYCTILNMKWVDAKSITDITERKFLYNKCLIMAESIRSQQMDIENKKAEVEQQLKNQLQDIQSQAASGATGLNL